ncbi:beta family protein [Myroides odoratimimus]|uniref:beta family protein n=1 Tax=Myroides odoratimimus TaxID=76832 RepID=UPI002DBF4797|nr:beta family protein [Myroides odoratimimus]MEC4094015.1 beta family protein [Myroides odoratimimus]
MIYNYTLIIRTGESEIKAIENSSNDILDKVFPVIEITRGRKKTEKNVKPEKITYPFETRLRKLKNILKGRIVGITLTNENLLKSDEINELYNPDNGYEAWVSFLLKVKEEGVFKEIVPTIIINPDDEYYEYNLAKQFLALKAHFKRIIYRNTIIDEYGYDDLDILKKYLDKNIEFSILVDCGYIPNATVPNVAEKTISRIKNYKELFDDSSINYIVAATSFPNNVNDMGGEDYDNYKIASVTLYNTIYSQGHGDIFYGDYGTINPIRNDEVIMARGWIPRIDVPLYDLVYYYRERRPKGVSAYADTYRRVAHKVVADDMFPININSNWGITQILNCSKGLKPGATPSFWIAVRMNIHIEQQVRRISKIN